MWSDSKSSSPYFWYSVIWNLFEIQIVFFLHFCIYLWVYLIHNWLLYDLNAWITKSKEHCFVSEWVLFGSKYFLFHFAKIFGEFWPLPRSFLVFSINFSGSKIDSSSLSFIQSRIFPGSEEMNSFNAEQIVKIETAPSSISSSWSNKRIISRTSPFLWLQNKTLN